MPDSLLAADEADIQDAIDGGKLYDPTGAVTSVADGPYKKVDDLPGMDNSGIKNGIPISNDDGDVYLIIEKTITTGESEDITGMYTQDEVDDLISSGWIPVANSTELHQIRKNGESLVFGEGTKWRGTFVSGLDKNYIQVRDIDLSSYGSGYAEPTYIGLASHTNGHLTYDGEGWFPLGHYYKFEDSDSEDIYFSGKYDGAGLFIANLYIDRPNQSYVGIFGQTTGSAEIKNMNIINPILRAYDDSGVLIGYSKDNTMVSNVNISNLDILSAGYEDIGGLIGNTEETTISRASISGTITVATEGYTTGGLVGYTDTTQIERSFADVDIIDNSGLREHVGGLVGSIDSGSILNSYSSGSVSGINVVGGLVGSNYDSNITFTHSSSTVTGSGSEVGGLIGEDYGTTVSSYYYKNPNNGYGIQLTDTDMTNESNFVGWDFINIWEISEKAYPTLK